MNKFARESNWSIELSHLSVKINQTILTMSKRRLPEWMATIENECNMKENKNENSTVAATKKQQQASENTEQNVPKRTLRSNSSLILANEPPKTKPSEYPFIKYNGKIKYLTEMHDIASACDEVMQWVIQQEEPIIPIAFDMEWPFSFQTGSGKSALIQICADLNICFLFQISQLKKLPAALLALLNHSKVRLHGVNIKNDFRKLERDFPEAKAQVMIDQCVDLGPWCNDVCNTGGRWSLERLVSFICKLRIDKNKKVRMSQWHVIPLSDDQKLYAAIDVYISQVIYKELEKREQEKIKATSEFIEKYGEQSLTAVKALGINLF